MTEINWLTFDAGLAQAKDDDKLVLVDFFNPG